MKRLFFLVGCFLATVPAFAENSDTLVDFSPVTNAAHGMKDALWDWVVANAVDICWIGAVFLSLVILWLIVDIIVESTRRWE